MLFLVPGLALLRQTACKLAAYGLPANTTLLLIGSDPSPIMLPTGDVIFMTTNLEAIEATIRAPSVVVIISTYLSSHLVQKALQSTGQSLQLSIYDEAHRVCGSAEPSAFNAMLLTPPNGNRVFLTATPTYDTPLRMDNTELFGGIAYRFYLREGISLGHINDFAVEVVLGNIDDMTSMVCKALTSVDKMLVFCKNIRHAEDLYDSVRKCTDVDHECFIAHSRLGSRGVTAALAQFRNAKRAVLFNVRLFQEGVEVPDLNAVFFAAPRYSPRDIIQSICRPLNKLDGKPQSTIFLPADFDATKPPDTPANLQRFSTLIPYTDALMDEDPTLFEYLIDPSKHNYRIKVVGVRELTTSDHDLQNVVLPSLRRGVRYSSTSVDRLHRAERLPWKLAFAELRRVVVECNRYPKINDAWIVGDARVPLHAFYRYCREGYQQHLDGVPSSLEQHQIRDLESLPSWTSYGVHGPYPWPECLATLRAYIAAHKEYPLLDIHRGGYIGLDATPFERLAGALCNINQQERQDYLAVSPEKQQDLDNLCNEFGVTWRKPRNKNGRLRAPGKSQITDCYDEFKRRFAQGDKNFLEYVEEHFPGYPLKHKFMESLAVQRGGTAPPRLKLRSESQLRRMKKRGDTDLRERVVVCRQCRVEVHASEWQQHINSEEHRKKTA